MGVNTNLTYYQKNKERILAYARNYYNNNKDKIKQKRDDLPQERKDKIHDYQTTWRNNRSDEEIINAKERSKTYSRNWYRNLPRERKIERESIQETDIIH